jgi:DNA-binding GntR family transcriptional regulator
MAVHSASGGSRKSSRRAKAEHGNSLRKAFHEIRELIVHGRLSPGSWIVEAALAKHLSMSRTPVRSALHLLRSEGYVIDHTSVRKSRMVVAPLTREDAEELYQVIGHVEGIAGRRTASLPKARRADIAAQLRRFNEQLRNITEAENARGSGIFEIDRSFHRTIIDAGAGPRLLALHKSIEPQAERYWRLYASWIMHDLQPSVTEHQEIIAGIVAGDPARTERALQVNWENGCERLAQVIQIFGERGSW